MQVRSWLIVPGDDETRLSEAAGAGADAIVVDLAATVASIAKADARVLAARWLETYRRQIVEQPRLARWVRIGPLDTPQWEDDLAAVMPAAPDGIVVPRATGPETVRELAAGLYEWEERLQLAPGSTRVLPLVGETPAAAMTIAAYVAAPHQRLAGLSWGGEALAGALGAARARDPAGGWPDVCRLARAQTLLTAHACGIAAIDAPCQEPGDEAALRSAALAARAEGFAGMIATASAQVSVINAAFTPSEAELAGARTVIAAFETSPGAEILEIGGELIDRTQLELARRMLGR